VRLGSPVLIAALAACAGPVWEPPRMQQFPPQVGWSQPKAERGVCVAAAPMQRPDVAATTARCAAGRRLALPLGRSTLVLERGRWVVTVAAPIESFVTIGVTGPAGALRGFEVVAPKQLKRLRTGASSDDGRLPTFVSFQTRETVDDITVVIDVKHRVRLLRLVVDHADRNAPPHRLVGLPYPVEGRAGYFLQAPTRYQFVRSDVAGALRAAFKQTRIRFKRGPIATGDASQWNGERPASDMDQPRHISHAGGRDVDIGLPSSDESASKILRRCDGVLVENDRLECSPGTVRNVDAVRLAYFLGLLIDGPTPSGRHIDNPDRRPGPIAEVETIFTDQAYIDEIRRALPKLRRKRWIHDEAYGALGEEGLLRPSPWHTDHVHIRFIGDDAVVPKVLQEP
jgi:hypothetical protein